MNDGGEFSKYKYCRYTCGQAYENDRNIKGGGGLFLKFGVKTLMGGGLSKQWKHEKRGRGG